MRLEVSRLIRQALIVTLVKSLNLSIGYFEISSNVLAVADAQYALVTLNPTFGVTLRFKSAKRHAIVLADRRACRAYGVAPS